MKFFQLIPLMLLAVTASAENIRQAQIVGSWSETYKVMKGELMTLEISKDMSVKLVRDFDESPDQVFRSEIIFRDGIWTVDFVSKEELKYKIVVAGWKQGQTSALFGTIYMYRNGELFNGVPISFRKDS